MISNILYMASHLKGIALSTLLLSLAVLITTACSDTARPENLEPVIEMLQPDDVTRTEAVISARVIKRGQGSLSYLDFYYGENDNFNCQSPQQVDADDSVFALRLHGLNPGTSYTCYAIGGTSTATLKSNVISFKTLPNDCPAVSNIDVLSTGPIGIIVEFEILEDGGEPILEAGCEVANTATSETFRVLLSGDCLNVGKHRLYITGLVPLTRYFITPFASNSIGETKGVSLEHTTGNSIDLSEAGSLQALFLGVQNIEFEQMTISGYMNGDDFRFLRHLLGAPVLPGENEIASNVTEVDLSDVRITEGGGSYDGSRFTVPDEVSTGLFSDCVRLRSIRLPSSALSMARDAFARCSSLKKLEVSAGITSLMPSEGCTSLETIEVSKANTSFATVDGVLFNREVTDILWFPLGKKGAYTLPETVNSIGEYAFSGTSITHLVIPSSVMSIGRCAFAGSSLCEISVPDNITNISEGMFQNCNALTKVWLGNNTQYIGNYVFDGSGIKDLYIATSVPPFTAGNAFVNRSATITATCTLHVPLGCKSVYRNNSKWGLFSNIEEYDLNLQ